MNSKILFLQADDVLSLRARVLRPGQDISKAKMPMDNEPTTFHLGLFIDDNLACVATFHEDSFAQLPAKLPYRLRGMATAFEFQGRGAGQQILQAATVELQKRNCDLLWCNAREKAFHFYEKCGFSFYGDMFDIAEIGPHKVMYKWLKQV